MNRQKQLDIREILSDHADTQRLIFNTYLNSNEPFSTFDCRVLIHCEIRQAEEIDLIYNGNPNEAVQCDDCGQWLCGEYCQCETLNADEKAELRRTDDNWTAEDLNAGLPSRA